MALAEAELIECLTLLGLPARIDVAFQFQGDTSKRYNAEVARILLTNLNADQEDAVTAILEQYRPIKFDTDTIQTEGLDSSPSRTRARLKGLLADIIGYSPASGGSGGFNFQRG